MIPSGEVVRMIRTSFLGVGRRYFCSHPDFGRVAKNVSDVSALIKSQLARSPVVLYMKGTPKSPQCGFSWKTVQVLEVTGAKYESHDVLTNESLRSGIKKFSEWPTIPQLYINGEFVGGCDIAIDMYRNGDLRKALEEAGAIREEQQETKRD